MKDLLNSFKNDISVFYSLKIKPFTFEVEKRVSIIEQHLRDSTLIRVHIMQCNLCYPS